MKSSCNFAFCTAALAVITAGNIAVNAQSAQMLGHQAKIMAGRSAAIALSIAMPQKQIPIGQIPWVALTVTNLSNNEIAFPKDQVHVEGPNGEPPTTLRQRQYTHRLQIGERPLMAGGFEPSIEPHSSSTRKYDLTQFYELNTPGKYSVSIQVLDVSAPETKHDAGLWVRSETVQFEMQPAAQ